MIRVHSFRRHTAACLILMLSLLALTGCFFEKTVIRSEPRSPQRQIETQKTDRVGEAEAAWNAGQTSRAEQLATRLVSQQGLSPQESTRAARILALSASANGHAYLAMSALERWQAAEPSASRQAEWRSAYLKSLSQLPAYEAGNKAGAVRDSSAYAFAVRADSAVFLAAQQWRKGGQAPQALAGLDAFYTQAPDKNSRGLIEHSLYTALHDADKTSLEKLYGLVTEENSKHFPYAIVSLETIRRLSLSGSNLPEAKEMLNQLAQGSSLADPGIISQWEEPLAVSSLVPLSGKNIVLALPLSGSMGSIGKKIAAGAEAARSEFSAAGHNVGLVLLDTNSPDWMDKLAALPPNLTIVGGPVRTSDFNEAHSRGLTRERVFMCFTPSLGQEVQEGQNGWRFFPSVEDQFNALGVAARRLQITRYAIVMPAENAYAAKMAELFTAHVEAGGGQVVKRLEYPPNAPDQWNRLIGSFLGTSKNASRAPSTSFQAIFLPDSWRNMELIVPNFFYFLESRQLLLGTSVWEQGLQGASHVTEHYYKTAVFPSPWSRGASPAGQRLRSLYARGEQDDPEFWDGLGYDFLRFASTLDIPSNWNPGTVNAALRGNSSMDWSIAPMSWSAQGQASQNLGLFTPSEEGFKPAHLDSIEDIFNKAWKR